MQRQMKIASNSHFHLHAAFLLPGAFPSAQRRGSICFILKLSACGNCFTDLLLACSSQVSPTVLKSRTPVSDCQKGCPIYREARLVLLDGLTASFLGVLTPLSYWLANLEQSHLLMISTEHITHVSTKFTYLSPPSFWQICKKIYFLLDDKYPCWYNFSLAQRRQVKNRQWSM